MFLVVGATVLTMLGRFLPSPDGDEGAAARLFQLTIALLVPAGLAFLVTADWRRPLKVAGRLMVPAVALVVAFSMLYSMEGARQGAARYIRRTQYLARQKGSHRQFKHERRPGLVTIEGKPGDDLAPGTLGSIFKQAGPKP